MAVAVWDRFLNQLPSEVFVCGRRCKITVSGKGGIDVAVDDSVDADVLTKQMNAFEGRKWMTTIIGNVPLSLSECDIPVSSRTAVADFLRFYLDQPIGPSMLMSERGHELSFSWHRQFAIDQAYLTWFASRFAARRSNDKLKNAIPCAGYFGDNRDLCRKSVLDLSCLCSIHKKKASRTLFNFYPWFEREGFAEFAEQLQSKHTVAVAGPTEIERAQKREQRTRSIAAKKRLMDILLAGNVGDTLTRKQIADVINVAAAPGEPGYHMVQSSIRKCKEVFVFWNWLNERGLYQCGYADRDGQRLLEMIQCGDVERTQLYDLMLKRFLAESENRMDEIADELRELSGQ